MDTIPVQCNITGNERADILAKKGSTAQQQNTTTSFRTAQQIIGNNSTEEWLNGWVTSKQADHYLPTWQHQIPNTASIPLRKKIK
ncbi:hypothetical protein ElyMa_003442300 [Elysia marginata]|uniref:RNase H type-1 domain-containing protein n=1 Tax=Elysia marginata TaxID=1093978 RepID=A0AAV4JRQ2_9GAST|nr:hypothetical protein ElyMa_003442300 [Elysia marginata]